MSFRGRNPPASLKRAPSRAVVARGLARAFPGEKSPGLIEATCPLTGAAGHDAQVSGGEIPRPH